jgi:hypothetical protein
MGGTLLFAGDAIHAGLPDPANSIASPRPINPRRCNSRMRTMKKMNDPCLIVEGRRVDLHPKPTGLLRPVRFVNAEICAFIHR